MCVRVSLPCALLLLLLQELNAIGDVAGKVSKGMQQDAIQQLPQVQVGQLRQQCSSGNGSSAGQQVQQLAQKALAAASM
jgi:hypothetical protein